jgi:biopolymer transport protein ExbD
MFGNLGKPKFRSPIKESSKIRPFGNNARKSIASSLMLTSLVDAFTIIVIYLVVNSSDGQQIDLKDGIELPQASFSQQLDASPVVVFKDDQFYIDDQVIPQNQLQARLTQLREKIQGLLKTDDPAIIVQADQNIDFDKMQPIMVASAYAGIKQVKFAVLQKD